MIPSSLKICLLLENVNIVGNQMMHSLPAPLMLGSRSRIKSHDFEKVRFGHASHKAGICRAEVKEFWI